MANSLVTETNQACLDACAEQCRAMTTG